MAQRVKMLRTKEYGDKKFDVGGFYVLEDAVAAYLIKHEDAGFVEEVSDKLLEQEKLTAKMVEEDARHEKADKEKVERANQAVGQTPNPKVDDKADALRPIPNRSPSR